MKNRGNKLISITVRKQFLLQAHPAELGEPSHRLSLSPTPLLQFIITATRMAEKKL